MNIWLDMLWECLNTGILAGLVALVLVISRPVLLRVFTAQQRVVIWVMTCGLGYMPWLKRGAVLPVTFQTLIVPRTGQFFTPNPAFLPVSYEGPGRYNLALPGVGLVEIGLNDMLVYGALILWLGVAAAICVYSFLQGRKLTARMKKGRLLGDEDPVYEDYRLNKKILEGETWVWVAEGLPTSFVRGHFFTLSRANDIAVQAELPPEQLELVLLHETQHVHLWHPWWKILGAVTLVLFWWNPLVWLGYRCFCRDMELACDAAVLKKLPPERRKEYARLLVELGSGRQLWEVPLAFGESDAAIRVKAAAKWKPRHILLTILSWCVAVLLMLFLYGGERIPYPAADLKLAYEREYGSMEQFVEDLNLSMAQALDLQPVAVETNCPDLGIVQVWEAPDALRSEVELAALWVQTEDGTWYHAPYGWWGQGTNTFFVISAKVCEAPDLTDAFRLV